MVYLAISSWSVFSSWSNLSLMRTVLETLEQMLSEVIMKSAEKADCFKTAAESEMSNLAKKRLIALKRSRVKSIEG